uniref:DUF4806 domain-containing protein n=1 Tax=Anopheles quadriannulatus TaxID=34691 RepID=A0A182X4S1_ANOQN
MPFAIVEAHEAGDANKQLYVVPEGWLLDTEQTETILLWPRCDGLQMYKLLTDGESVANTKWIKMNCTVKMINIPNLSVAHGHVSKLKGECIEPSKDIALQVVQKCPTPSPLEEECSNVPCEEDISEEKAESSFSKTHTKTTEIAPASVRTISEKDFYNFLLKVNQKITLLEALVCKITDKVVYLEAQAQMLQSRLNSRTAPKQPMISDVDFKQIDCLQSLESFNEKLLDKEYQDKMYQWLNAQITEVKSENRMTEAIDILFTKRFMTKCSWTGVGRGSEKIAMMRMVNISKLFRRVGTTATIIVNQRMVMLFFMKKLRNAVRRSEMKHLRRSTSHNVPSHKAKTESQ